MNTNKYKKGFTLIEVMVVIAIIGFMSSVIMAGLTATRAKARDTQRIAELRSIEKALNLYAVANNGLVPTAPYNSWNSITASFSSGAAMCSVANTLSPYNVNTVAMYNTLTTAKALATKPSFTTMNSLGYCYMYIPDATGKSAIVAIALEGKKNTNGTQSVAGIVYGTTPPDWVNINLTTGANSLATSPLGF